MDIKKKYNSKEKIIKYADSIFINLNDKEIENLINEFDDLLIDLNDFYAIDDKGIEPTHYIIENINTLRPDIIEESNNKKEVINCSKNVSGEYVKV